MRTVLFGLAMLSLLAVSATACGVKRCDATTCNAGCCQPDGTCSSISTTSCGKAGAQCRACANNNVCVDGACMPPGSAGGGGGTGGSGGGVAGVGGAGGEGGGVGGTGGVDPCSDEAKLIYVVDQDNTFASFNPQLFGQARALTTVGTLSCPARNNGAPYSMAVSRDAIAWVLYNSSQLFKVDVRSNLRCDATTFAAPSGTNRFGMGFSVNAPGSSEETLFIAGHGASTASFGTLSLDAPPTLSFRGTVQGAPELSGTGDAKLWGFKPDTMQPLIAQYNKTDGSVLRSLAQPMLRGNPSAWAFAFWGGDFFVFLQKGLEVSTTVYRIGDDGMLKASMVLTGRSIVGAGVSTCAPIDIQ